MKKMFIGATSLVLGMSVLVPAQSTFANVTDSDFTWSDNGDGTAKITTYNGTEKNVVIPDKLNGLTVTTIGSSAFSDKQLTSVVIPDSVTIIDRFAFQKNQLTSVIIPDGVTSIGMAAFSENQLTSLVIPDSVTFVGERAFQINKLTNISISNGMTSIEPFTFMRNELTSVVIPDSVEIIGMQAFVSNNIASLTLPDGLTTIQRQSFQNNNLTNVAIPNSVTSIGDGAFKFNNISTVDDVIPKSATETWSLAFDSFDEPPSLPEQPGEDVGNGGTNNELDEDVSLILEGGELSLAISSLLSFGNIKIEKQPKTYTTSFQNVFNVVDATGTQEGWRLDVSATQFEVVEPEGGFAPGTFAHKLPKGTLSLSPISGVGRVGVGYGNLPDSALASKTIIDDGVVTVARAIEGEGMGEFFIEFPEDALSVIIDPTTAKVDKINYSKESTPYESTITWTLVTGP